jgi:hypothetical protein
MEVIVIRRRMVHRITAPANDYHLNVTAHIPTIARLVSTYIHHAPHWCISYAALHHSFNQWAYKNNHENILNQRELMQCAVVSLVSVVIGADLDAGYPIVL